MMKIRTEEELSPPEISFTCPLPESTGEYERILRYPVRFGQKQTSFALETGIINSPIRYANPDLLEYFENYAREIIADLDRDNKHTREVTRIILTNLDDDALSIRRVAREMSVRVRTLQNWLKSEGVVFTDLMTDVRKKLARKYLHENYSVEEITYLPGYSEPSAFRKAFKKWSGVTPRQFRGGSYSYANHFL